MPEEDHIKLPDTVVPRPEEEPERLGVLQLLLFLVLTLSYIKICFQIIAVKLYLICRYSWSEVVSQNLHFDEMRKGSPWHVSNGDWLYCEATVGMIGAMFVFPLAILTLIAIDRLWPKRRDRKAGEPIRS